MSSIVTDFWQKYTHKRKKSLLNQKVSPFFNTRIEHCLKEKNLWVYSFSNNNLIALRPSDSKEETSLSFTKTAGKNREEYQVENKELNLNLGIALRTIRGNNQFVLATNTEELTLHQDDCITIMFKNRTALTFVLLSPVIKKISETDIRNEACTGLTLPDLEKLAFQEPIAWHYFSHENPNQYSGSFSEKESQGLQEMAGCFYRVAQKHKLLTN